MVLLLGYTELLIGLKCFHRLNNATLTLNSKLITLQQQKTQLNLIYII